jgi:hypothetical protein
MTRPRLDAVLARRERKEIDDEGCLKEVMALATEMGREPVMGALTRKVETASDVERDVLMALIPKLGGKETVAHLWRMVHQSKMSAAVKSTALVVLKEMGEDVDLDHPGTYFSIKDAKPSDAAEMTQLGRHSLEMLVKELHKVKSIGEIEGFMETFDQAMPRLGNEGQLFMIEELEKIGRSGAADMLLAIVHATARSDVRQAARNALLKLSGRGVFPQSSLVKQFSQEQFYAAYCTDPADPWQQQLVMAWEWPGDLTQAIVFLFDFGLPWRGSIKDMFVTQYMPKRRLHQELLEKHLEHRRIPFTRARQAILNAVEANRRHRMRLPPEYDQFRRLIERRIVSPAPEALAQAESLDAETVDEWGEPEDPIVRGEQLVGDKPVVFLDQRTLEAWEELSDSEEDSGRGNARGFFLKGIFRRK